MLLCYDLALSCETQVMHRKRPLECLQRGGVVEGMPEMKGG